MDADENTLPPTAEDEGSLLEEETGMESSQNEGEVEKMSRKDSQCTVVECKPIQEAEVEAKKPTSLEKLSSGGSSDYKDAQSQNSKGFEEPENLTTPESEKSRPLEDLEQAPPSPESTYLAANSSLEIETIDSTSSLQDRVQMWLDDSHCSIPTDKEEETTNKVSPKDEWFVRDLSFASLLPLILVILLL